VRPFVIPFFFTFGIKYRNVNIIAVIFTIIDRCPDFLCCVDLDHHLILT
jgi:hypothetical protein